MKKIILAVLIVLFGITNSFAQEKEFLPVIDSYLQICNFLKSKRIITSNYCIIEESIGFNIDNFPDNYKSYSKYFTEFIKINVSITQFDRLFQDYDNSNLNDEPPAYSNKKLWVVHKPIIIENDYFILISKIEKNTNSMFLIHLKINDEGKFSIINKSGFWE